MVQLDRNLESQCSSATVSDEDVSSVYFVLLLEEDESPSYILDVIWMLYISRRVVGLAGIGWVVWVWRETIIDRSVAHDSMAGVGRCEEVNGGCETRCVHQRISPSSSMDVAMAALVGYAVLSQWNHIHHPLALGGTFTIRLWQPHFHVVQAGAFRPFDVVMFQVNKIRDAHSDSDRD